MKKLSKIQKNNNFNNNGSSPWSLEYFNFDPGQEKLREALCTLGNGYLGTRGAFTEVSSSRIFYPGTYMAGVFNKLDSHIAGKTISNEDLVNCPNWLPLTFKTDKQDNWIYPEENQIISFYQKLDLKEAALIKNYTIREESGRITSIQTRRIVSMQQMHLVALEYSITPENYEGEIVIKTGLDGNIENEGVERYSDLSSLHLDPDQIDTFADNGICLSVVTNQSRIKIALSSTFFITGNGQNNIKPTSVDTIQRDKSIYQEYLIKVQKNQKYTFSKIVSIYTSQDKDTQDPLASAIKLTRENNDFETLYQSNKKAWTGLWEMFDIRVSNHLFSQKALRLHIFHLLQTGSIHNTKLDAGIPARGLSGEAYRGHIFWDEVFILPVYDFRIPEITQSALLYRYRRLDAARKYAEENGYKGAMFPWQSGSTGEEETQTIHLNPQSGKWGPDNSRNQRHISFDIAYSIWEHWIIAENRDFMINYGAELFLSIAIFGASLVFFDKKNQKYHTEGLMGPDEFHERLPEAENAGLRDNAYTNIMIVWTLKTALNLLNSILSNKQKVSLLKKLNISKDDLRLWDDITKKMNIIINPEGIISQFDGYFDLKELDWKAYKEKYGNIQRMDRILKAEGKSPNEYKVAKQADTLMLPYLFSIVELKELFNGLGYEMNIDIIKKNYDYYVQRTSHGSTLSKVVHCYLADILGKTKQSWEWYCDVLNSDINDIQGGTTPEGIHTGVMGGSLYIAQKRYAGVNLVDGIIDVEPDLPEEWDAVNFKIKYKDIWYVFEIMKDKTDIELKPVAGKTIEGNHKQKIKLYKKEYFFSLNKKHTVFLKENGEKYD